MTRPYRDRSMLPGVLLAILIMVVGFLFYLILTATPANGREPVVWSWDPVPEVENAISRGEEAGYRIRLFRACQGNFWLLWGETQQTSYKVVRWPRNTELTYIIATSFIGNLESENKERAVCP